MKKKKRKKKELCYIGLFIKPILFVIREKEEHNIYVCAYSITLFCIRRTSQTLVLTYLYEFFVHCRRCTYDLMWYPYIHTYTHTHTSIILFILLPSSSSLHFIYWQFHLSAPSSKSIHVCVRLYVLFATRFSFFFHFFGSLLFAVPHHFPCIHLLVPRTWNNK